MTEELKAPFPWFGGKRRVAPEVWAALGDVDNYVEPFAGSLAVLLGRPLNDDRKLTETVNDMDGFLCNFWRAVAADPDQVAHYASYPVNETDLFARHLWLVNTGRSILLNGMEADPDWYDAKVAGWWVWGLCSWIGAGWCAGTGPWMADADGIIRQRPHLGDGGQGINRQLPHLGNNGQGINRQRPHLGDDGQGDAAERLDGITHYLRQLSDRLRDVRVCQGDWKRVVTNGALSAGTTVGVFLDPPYLGEVRTADLYTCDDHTIANEVREWALANGTKKNMRVVLAGYLPEHDHLIPDTWTRHRWSASISYGTAESAKRQEGSQTNRHLECLWLSPHCQTTNTSTQLDIFNELDAKEAA